MPLDNFTGQLGKRNAAHLLRRATFGPTPGDIANFATMTVSEAMDILFQEVPDPQPPVDPVTGTTWLNPAATGSNSPQEDLIDFFMAWHLEQMRNSGTSVKERLVWFLHTHLPVRRSVVPQSEYLYYQNALFRFYAMGSFKTLFRKIVVDNAMMIFIDNATNDVISPNENFAREMFELYSIGRGAQIAPGNYSHYTEDDIKAATRVLTGWEVTDQFDHFDQETGLPTARLKTTLSGATEIANRHDKDPKHFSPLFQNRIIQPSELYDGYATPEAAEAELDELIEMIFDQDETSRFITRKIYRFFVYYEITPEVESQVIQPLATDFRNSDFNLEVLVRNLLSSKHFFDTDNIPVDDNNQGALIKSPLEIIIGLCRMFEVQFPAAVSTLYQTVYQEGLLPIMENQGLPFFEPYDVAGFEAYFQFPNFNRNWITPYSLAYRYQFSVQITQGINANNDALNLQFNFLDWIENGGNISDPSIAETLIDELSELLFPFPLSAERRDYFILTILLDGLYPASYWTTRWNAYKSSPGPNKAEIEGMLENLFHGLIQSPEYQLF
jgi:uncharacterized protein (DUF1800 family)